MYSERKALADNPVASDILDAVDQVDVVVVIGCSAERQHIPTVLIRFGEHIKPSKTISHFRYAELAARPLVDGVVHDLVADGADGQVREQHFTAYEIKEVVVREVQVVIHRRFRVGISRTYALLVAEILYRLQLAESSVEVALPL